MLALIAGTGDLPPALIERLPVRPIICAIEGFSPAVSPDIVFRLERLGTLIKDLQERGVTKVCMAGAVRRPKIDPEIIDAATLPLVAKIMLALRSGDDGALRAVITIFEGAGFEVVAAHDIAADLIPNAGALTKTAVSSTAPKDAIVGENVVAEMGARDIGQACVVQDALVVARENQDGTDAMLLGLATKGLGKGAILFKAPKPDQDRRADLPLIGLDTARNSISAGFAGIVIEAGGVMVLDLPAVVDLLDAQGMFLWVRPKGGE